MGIWVWRHFLQSVIFFGCRQEPHIVQNIYFFIFLHWNATFYIFSLIIWNVSQTTIIVMYFLRWWWSVYRDYLFQWTSSVLLKDVHVNYALTKKVMKKVTNDVFSKYFVKTLKNLFQKIISFCSVVKWTNQWCGWSGICCQHLRLSWRYIPNIRH